jgi:hypothetical protein
MTFYLYHKFGTIPVKIFPDASNCVNVFLLHPALLGISPTNWIVMNAQFVNVGRCGDLTTDTGSSFEIVVGNVPVVR